MPDEITLEVDSALDLNLKGSVGSFKVGSGDLHQSLEVKYFLTHVGLNFSSGSDEKLLKELAPVREIFDPKQLDFDEIMQRDIDDARVSNELIPYILDDKTKDLVKFFPPIVIIVLPISEDRNKPEKYYPEVYTGTTDLAESGVNKWLITRSGDVGSEVFEFKQPMQSGKENKHDLVSLKLNTSKCRLVIVDGQHRAMSLLALYRNIKDQWSDSKRSAFKKYYEEWTPDYIREFNLTEINLPLIICTIPTLDTKYSGDYDLKKASRSIFLTLNKTARKVSRTRNLLLNDNDLISSFMRKTLGVIKDADVISGHSLSIHNVELDQDQQKIKSPIAITGVSHIYYMAEHLLLDSGDITGVQPRSGRFSTRISFSDALDRLNCNDNLGQEACGSTRRDSFTNVVEEKLKGEYQRIYGSIIIKALNNFFPFDSHNRATLDLRASIHRGTDIDLESMLFEGQGVINVFEDHRSNLKKKLKDNYFERDVPRINSIVDDLDNVEARLKLRIKELYGKRAEKYISSSSEKNKYKNDNSEIHDNVSKLINGLFDDVFTTVAFQSAIICGFFNEYEKISKEFQGQEDLNLDEVFDEYLLQINSYFTPVSFSSFKKIISLLIGRAEGDDSESLSISVRSNDSFRGVVFHNEMQPDQWPKYRYLLLEIWKPSNESLSSRINEEVLFCRDQVFRSLYERKKKIISQEKSVAEDDLTREDLDLAFDQAFNDYAAYLKHYGRSSEITKTHFKSLLQTPEHDVESVIEV